MIKKINLEKIIYILTLIIMIGLPSIKLLSYILYLFTIIDNSFIVNQVYILWIILPILIIIYIIGIIKKQFKINIYDILIYILIVLGIISTIYAQDIKISIIGETTRNEGLLSLLSYYFIFLNIKNIKKGEYKKNIINIFLIIGIFQVIYGILQSFTNFTFIKHYTISYMAMGLCGNPNFFGSYTLMLLIFSLTLYLLNDKKTYLILTIIFYIGLLLASSTGPFLGLVITLVFILIKYFKQINKKRLILLIMTFITLFYITDYSLKYTQQKYNNVIDDNYSIKNEIEKTVNSLETIKKDDNKIINTLGNNRISLWIDMIPFIKEYGLVGAGIDNIGVIYEAKNGIHFDKVHNIYLQMLITNGVGALLVYLFLCLNIFIDKIRNKKPFYIALFVTFIAYSIQGFANISVIDVAPYFFIILGLLIIKEDSELIK